jgi:hypothetical protein
MKATIDISEDKSRVLKSLSRQRGVPTSTLLNEALDMLIKSSVQLEEPQAFGIWKGKVSDGLEYEARMRGEWSR